MSTKKLSSKSKDNSVSHIIMNDTFSKLAKECKQYVTCDTIRISKPLENGKMFLIIGFNRNTKDDAGVWINQNGKKVDFDYVQESCVASGYTKEELIASTKEYQRLCGMTWEEYLTELQQSDCNKPADPILCIGFNDAAKKIHENAKRKGFWDKKRETGTLLMLCVSELSEALEADRKNRFAKLPQYEKEAAESGEIPSFEFYIKDTFEDELADTIIRILDLCGAKGIDIEKHINLKLEYNQSRERMHGKAY